MKAFHSLLAAVILIAAFTATLVADDSDYLPYDKFIAEVESGSVKAVSLDRFSQIAGTYSVGGAERPFTSYGGTGSSNDVLLNRLLKQKGVAVTVKEQKERSMFGESFIGFLMVVVPVVTLLLALRINSKLNRLPK